MNELKAIATALGKISVSLEGQSVRLGKVEEGQTAILDMLYVGASGREPLTVRLAQAERTIEQLTTEIGLLRTETREEVRSLRAEHASLSVKVTELQGSVGQLVEMLRREQKEKEREKERAQKREEKLRTLSPPTIPETPASALASAPDTVVALETVRQRWKFWAAVATAVVSMLSSAAAWLLK